MNAIIVSHTYTHGVQHELLNYLKKKSISPLVLISHSLHDLKREDISQIELYEDGRLTKESKLRFPRIPIFFSYLKDVLATFLFVIKTRKKFDVYVGADSLNLFSGLLLKKMGIIKRLVYYCHSYHKKRFNSKFNNFIYHLLDKKAINSSDFIWSLSERLTLLREKQGVPKKKNMWVPVGINFNDIERLPAHKIDRKKIVFTGLLTEKNGVELSIKSLPIIIKEIPDIKLIIVGSGPLENKLKSMVKKYELDNFVKFLGYVGHNKMMDFLPKCGIGIAPYAPMPDSTLLTTDPTKIKEYLACGLPVITTGISEIAQYIKKYECGFVIRYNKKDFADAIIALIKNDRLFFKYRKNSIEFAKNYDWNNIFNRVYNKVFINV